MKLGVVIPVELGVTGEPDKILEFARAAESLGFDEISAVEHSVVIGDTDSAYPYSPTGKSHLPDDCDIPDPLELLSFVAGATTTLGLATGVLVLPNHNPVVLAKRLATLDRLSGGRLRICLGVGWMREEIEACGGRFDRRGEGRRRGDRGDARAVGRRVRGRRLRGRALLVRAGVLVPEACAPVRRAAVHRRPQQGGRAAGGAAGRRFPAARSGGDDLDAAVALMRSAAVETPAAIPSEVALVLGHLLTRVDEVEARLGEVARLRSDPAVRVAARDHLRGGARRDGRVLGAVGAQSGTVTGTSSLKSTISSRRENCQPVSPSTYRSW